MQKQIFSAYRPLWFLWITRFSHNHFLDIFEKMLFNLLSEKNYLHFFRPLYTHENYHEAKGSEHDGGVKPDTRFGSS